MKPKVEIPQVNDDYDDNNNKVAVFERSNKCFFTLK
jgi:hypothetical protein